MLVGMVIRHLGRECIVSEVYKNRDGVNTYATILDLNLKTSYFIAL